MNVTVPLGVPVPGETAVTVAVNTTESLKTAGLSEELSATLLLALLTAWVTVVEVLVLKLTSPL